MLLENAGHGKIFLPAMGRVLNFAEPSNNEKTYEEIYRDSLGKLKGFQNSLESANYLESQILNLEN